MTGASRVVRVAGPVMVGAQIAVVADRVLTAEEGEHLWTAGEEISSFAGGTLGASAGGVVSSTLGAVAVGAGVVVSAPVAIAARWIRAIDSSAGIDVASPGQASFDLGRPRGPGVGCLGAIQTSEQHLRRPRAVVDRELE